MTDMSQENLEKENMPADETVEDPVEGQEQTAAEQASSQDDATPEDVSVDEAFAAAIQEKEEQYLRLLAEYDNFRKRSLRERETAWNTAKAETTAAFLPVYDNLARALKQETADEAYAKGVQMTMTQLRGVLEKLGIVEISALGETFNPELHNAVMHVEDETVGPNTVVEVFETGFQSDGKVIRFAMVKVAN